MTLNEFTGLQAALRIALRDVQPEQLLESDGSHNYYVSRGSVLQWKQDYLAVMTVLNEFRKTLKP